MGSSLRGNEGGGCSWGAGREGGGALLQQLYKKGLLYLLAVPIGPSKLSIPPLEVGQCESCVGARGAAGVGAAVKLGLVYLQSTLTG